MKRWKHKNQEPPKINFTPMKGDNGFTLDYNPIVRRFDLRQNGEFLYSHMASVVCINIARSRFDVEMAVPKDKKNEDN